MDRIDKEQQVAEREFTRRRAQILGVDLDGDETPEQRRAQAELEQTTAELRQTLKDAQREVDADMAAWTKQCLMYARERERETN